MSSTRYGRGCKFDPELRHERADGSRRVEWNRNAYQWKFVAEVIDSATECFLPAKKEELVITCISKEALPHPLRTRILQAMYEPCAWPHHRQDGEPQDVRMIC